MVTINQSLLKIVLDTHAKMEKYSSLQVLKSMYVESDGITLSDLVHQVRFIVSLEDVEAPFLIDLDRLKRIAKSGDLLVTPNYENHAHTVKVGKLTCNMLCLAPNDFPRNIPAEQPARYTNTPVASIDPNTLWNILTKCPAFVSANDGTNRNAILDVMFQEVRGHWSAVGTDGRRMFAMPINDPLASEPYSFTPETVKLLTVLARHKAFGAILVEQVRAYHAHPVGKLDDKGNDIGGQEYLRNESMRITGRIGHNVAIEITTKWPDYMYPRCDQVVPSRCDIQAEIPKSDLCDAVRSIADVLGKRSAITLRLKTVTDGLRVSASSSDFGDLETCVPCVTTRDFAMDLNCQYLTDALEALDGSAMRIRFRDEWERQQEIRQNTPAPGESAHVRPDDADLCPIWGPIIIESATVPGAFGIIMPMRN